MKLIDNVNLRAVDFLAEHINQDVSLSVVSALFSIYAFDKLRERIPHISKLKLLFSGASDTNVDFDLVGGVDERMFRNQLLQQFVAEQCRKWFASNSEIMSMKAVGIVNQNLICCDAAAVQGGADMTSAGLGLVASMRHDISSGFVEHEIIEKLAAWFASVWGDSAHVEDLKEEFLSRLQWLASDKSPEFVYHKMLYHILASAKGDADDGKALKTKTGIYEHEVWKRLYKFQLDGVIGAIDKLEKYNGCIIADSVGLGKTFEALAIIKYYELRNDRVLVLCPKKLRENWTIFLQNDKRNIFCDDRFGYDVLCHTDLNRTSGKSGDINLATVNWGNYDLVVIDESHNFRNNPPSRKRGLSRYRRLMQDVIRAGVKTKVLMLSATPVNNRMADLKNQVAFITEGEDSALADEGIKSIEQTLSKAQKKFNLWLDAPGHDTKSLLDAMDFDYFKLLDLLTIARSRRHIEKYYNMGDIVRFPERLKPINIKEDIDTLDEFPPLKEVNKTIQRLHLAAYSPLKYVLPENFEKYARKYDIEMDGGKRFAQLDREASLIHLMRINILKRMESSIHAFKMTAQRLLDAVDALLGKLENYNDDTDVGDIDINGIETDSQEFEDLLVGEKIKVLIKDCDVKRWKQELSDDRAQLALLVEVATKVSPDRDRKLVSLKQMIENKVKSPINPGNKKVIVFTAFADTAAYLYGELSAWAKTQLGIDSALVTGAGTNKTTMQGVSTDIHTLLTNFSPRSKDRARIDPEAKDGIDLLFATDCISEGQNLQDCDWLVNYDIHWNPVRIIQRFGRIDRLGSVNSAIQLVNFWPNMELDEYINLEERVSGRMVLLDINAAGEENVIAPSQQMNDLEYRRRQLQQLQEAVLDLEDISGGISITDLTLNDFRMDLAKYMKENGKAVRHTPFGARTELPPMIAEGSTPGAIFCLKDMSGKASPDAAYALAPYYLVHVADDGSIVCGYTQSRETLNHLKKACLEQNQPCPGVLEKFNLLTKNGADMGHYQHLLGQAVASIVGRQQEEGVKSLFSRGGIRLSGSADRNVEDFEVVAFAAIMGAEKTNG